MSDMTKTSGETVSPDLAEMRAIAEKATPGPWINPWETDDDNDAIQSASGERIVFADWYDRPILGCTRENAAHIATFDPPTVLSLLDRLTTAEAARRDAIEKANAALSSRSGEQ